MCCIEILKRKIFLSNKKKNNATPTSSSVSVHTHYMRPDIIVGGGMVLYVSLYISVQSLRKNRHVHSADAVNFRPK